jgi:nucleolar GTP-binding protein
MIRNLKRLELPQVLLDAAFLRGRKRAAEYPEQRTYFYTMKGSEISRIDAISDYLLEKLDGAVKEFPSIEHLDPFYRDLFYCILDVDATRKNLSSISSVAGLLRNVKKISLVQLKELRFGQNAKAVARDATKKFIGRSASLIKGLEKNIIAYNKDVTALRELPVINLNTESYILAGYPNAGKSTMMKRLTPSKPESAPYPFTTKGLNVGFTQVRHIPIQVIDTPGLLDRSIASRNKIELKAITALQHIRGTIVFIVDPFEDANTQIHLLKEIKKLFSEKPIIAVVNKTDIADKEKVAEIKKALEKTKIPSKVIEDGEGIDGLKKEIDAKRPDALDEKPVNVDAYNLEN